MPYIHCYVALIIMGKIKKSCMNCKNVDMCIFRIKLHTEFSGILRNGIGFHTLEKTYKVFAKDCNFYKCNIPNAT